MQSIFTWFSCLSQLKNKKYYRSVGSYYSRAWCPLNDLLIPINFDLGMLQIKCSFGSSHPRVDSVKPVIRQTLKGNSILHHAT